MHRKSILVFAAFLIIIGSLLPLVATLYFSWQSAEATERDKLYHFADRVIRRARITLDQAYQSLRMVNNAGSGPCSEENIKAMRMMDFKIPSISDVGYFENGYLKCNSWGMVEEKIPQTPSDFIMANGVGISFNMRYLFTDNNTYMGLNYNNYSVIIDPTRFSDIIVDPYIQIAIATSDGHIFSTLNDPNLSLVKQAIENPSLNKTKDSLIAVSKIPDLIVVVIESRSYMLKGWHKEALQFLPFGIFISAVVVGLIVWGSHRRLSPLGELKIAVIRKEFLVHYQPIIDLKTKTCIGAEALIRWQRPDGTMIRPDWFIPLAEEGGLILEITKQVVESVVKDLKDILISDRNMHIAVNVAACDLKSGRILKVIEEALAGTNIEHQQIWLEATERGLMDIVTAKSTIAEARHLGYPVAIDDFGTGYSSLSYLQNLPLDVLKIDKSFIDALETQSATSNVTLHIINIAKTLNLKTVAEGVETVKQAEYLLKHEVDYGQGWLFAKAMPVKEFIKYYLQHQASSD